MKKRIQQRQMTFGEYCTLYANGAIQNHAEIMASAPKPRRLCGRYLPESLDTMTMGKLAEVMKVKEDTKLLTTIYNVTTSELMTEWALDVIGTLRWTADELKRITELFSQLERELTADEIMAGAEQLKGDIFTTINWFFRYCNGKYSHDEVLKVPWIVVWRCARDHQQTEEYRQRLHNIQHQRR